MKETKIGLVLEGGAMRGMFTCGVIDVLMEQGITFDGAIGVSAGAVFGCNVKSKQIGRGIRYNKKYCNDIRYCSFWSLRHTGNLYNEAFCYHKIPNELDVFDRKTFAENPLEFYVVTTDAATGKALYHRCSDGGRRDMKWLQGSASMPIVSKLVEVDGHKMVDGGVADSIPLSYLESIGYDRNVVVLTQPRGYVKKKNRLAVVAKKMYKEYPAIGEAMAKRHEIYNEQTKHVLAQEKAGRALVLCPPEKLDLSRTEKDPAKLEKAYQVGRKIATERLEEIRAFVKKQE